MKSGIDEMRRASESAMMFAPESVAFTDRKQFVQNLGWLLAQTREGILRCDLDEHDIVTVYYKNDDYQEKINVHCDSYLAIIRDVTRHL